MSSERMRIPWEDQGKYQKIITQGNKMWTEVIYDDIKGTINEEQTYSSAYLKKLREAREDRSEERVQTKTKKARVKEEEEDANQESDSWIEKCFKAILLAPFKLIWWLIKLVFWIVFWSWLSSVLGISKNDD